MKTISEKLDKMGVPLEEMAKILPDESGLPMAVIILDGTGLPHGPRIKVSAISGGKVRRDELVQVTIEDNPKFMYFGNERLNYKNEKLVIDFILKNKQILIDHYYGRISDKQALNAIEKI